DNGCNWLSAHADRLYEAGVGFRTACTTSQLIRNTIELFRLSDSPGSGGPHTVLARIHAGKGKGELWLNWYTGMDETLPVAAHLSPDEAVWPSSDKVPDAVRFGLWLRIAPDDVDQATFDAWIDGVIAAAGCSGLASWPRFAMPRLYALTLQCNSMLPAIASAFNAKTAMTKEDLRTALGGDRAALGAINRLLYWQSRYMRVSPLRTRPDGLIELDPAINCPDRTPAVVGAGDHS
ncbi:MAG: hypothetical protein HOI89_10005, partial [Phycisphaerae bacterium]|nr:hypothetical protein [Phycisphaerae bacterium]